MAEITQSLEKQTAQGGDHATGSPCHPGSRALLLLLPCLLPIRDLSLALFLPSTCPPSSSSSSAASILPPNKDSQSKTALCPVSPLREDS